MSLLSRKASSLKATDVFTPARIPLGENNVLVRRTVAEEHLDLFVESGQVPVVYGEYGVGKTTLVLGYFKDYPADSKVEITVSSKTTLREVFQTVLETMGYEIVQETMTRDMHQNDFGVNAVLKGKLGEEYGTEKISRLVVTSPTDAKLVQLMREREFLIVLDELHKSSPEFKADLSSFLKAVRASQSKYPSVVLTGTTLSVGELTAVDEGVARYLKPVLVKPMTAEEARSIVVDGFARLEITISDHLVEKVVTIAAGAPTLVQELCLKTARACMQAGRTEILGADYEQAVRDYLSENEQRLTRGYVVSIEHQGQKRYRKQILGAMSTLDKDIASLEDIRIRVSELMEEEIPSTALSGPLKELKTGDDSILVDFSSRGRQAAQILTVFREPMMKSFVRFIRQAEQQGLAPEARALLT